MARKPKLAVWKLASCDGCQLTLLDCEDELLALAGAVEIAHFTEASSGGADGPYDVSLVEGSVTTERDARRILEIRESSRVLVCIGACATAGGIQALRNFADVAEFTSVVYARLLRLQAARYGVRDGGPRHPVPRSGHPGRMRRRLPCLRPRLLRLLRPGRRAEPAGPGRPAPPSRDDGQGPAPRVRHLQRRGPRAGRNPSLSARWSGNSVPTRIGAAAGSLNHEAETCAHGHRRWSPAGRGPASVAASY
jgi:Ni,Fe-hydrogenase III small subunit